MAASYDGLKSQGKRTEGMWGEKSITEQLNPFCRDSTSLKTTFCYAAIN